MAKMNRKILPEPAPLKKWAGLINGTWCKYEINDLLNIFAEKVCCCTNLT